MAKKSNKEETATVTVEKTSEETKGSKINPEVIAKLKQAIEDKTEELENKKYLIPGGDDVAKKIQAFIVDNAKWKFTESIGVIEVNRIIKDFLADAKKKEFMIPTVALEATYYFLAKHEGVGLEEAETFTELLKAINQAKSRADQDKKDFEEMQFRLQSLEHGVDPDAPEETLGEDAK